MKSLLAVVVAIMGVASLVFGIVFIAQSGSAKQQIADGLQPMPLDQLNATYDRVDASQVQMMAAEEPNIQTGKAAPSAMYNYLTTQKTGLGLAQSNVGFADFLKMNGIIQVITGVGLLLAGLALMKKS